MVGMKMNRWSRMAVKSLTASIGLLFLIFLYLSQTRESGRYRAASIMLGTAFYLFIIRHLSGDLVRQLRRTPWNYENAWFREKDWEQPLYRQLRVRRWKDYLPTNRPEDFDLEQHSIDYIINTSCRSEVVHEIIIVASFGILLIPLNMLDDRQYFGLFLLTALVSALTDTIFTIVQRFNRPRLISLKERLDRAEVA